MNWEEYTSVYEYLPMLKGWAYRPVDVDDSFTLQQNEKKLIGEIKSPAYRSGWFHSGLVYFSDPNDTVQIELYDGYGNKRTSTASPYGLYAVGYTAPNNAGLWVPKYDAINSVYSMGLSPSAPLAFKDRMALYLVGSSISSSTCYGYSYLLITIEDEALFRESYRQLITGDRAVDDGYKRVIGLPAVGGGR